MVLLCVLLDLLKQFLNLLPVCLPKLVELLLVLLLDLEIFPQVAQVINLVLEDCVLLGPLDDGADQVVLPLELLVVLLALDLQALEVVCESSIRLGQSVEVLHELYKVPVVSKNILPNRLKQDLKVWYPHDAVIDVDGVLVCTHIPVREVRAKVDRERPSLEERDLVRRCGECTYLLQRRALLLRGLRNLASFLRG